MMEGLIGFLIGIILGTFFTTIVIGIFVNGKDGGEE